MAGAILERHSEINKSGIAGFVQKRVFRENMNSVMCFLVTFGTLLGAFGVTFGRLLVNFRTFMDNF